MEKKVRLRGKIRLGTSQIESHCQTERHSLTGGYSREKTVRLEVVIYPVDTGISQKSPISPNSSSNIRVLKKQMITIITLTNVTML